MAAEKDIEDDGLVTLVLREDDLWRDRVDILINVDDVEDIDEIEQASLKDRGSSFRNSTADLNVTRAKLINNQ
ncbi:hypothetical protein Unana1_08654 [Umbelopsis nana]